MEPLDPKVFEQTWLARRELRNRLHRELKEDVIAGRKPEGDYQWNGREWMFVAPAVPEDPNSWDRQFIED